MAVIVEENAEAKNISLYTSYFLFIFDFRSVSGFFPFLKYFTNFFWFSLLFSLSLLHCI